MDRTKPLILLILDGWGYRENLQDNAIAAAKTPHWDTLWQQSPHCLLDASGHAVGVPKGQMGNSEVGHLHMGAGRFVPQDLVRIDEAIKEGSFFQNKVIVEAVQTAVKKQKAIHILGLLSKGGVHSHENHILAMMELAAQQHAKHVYLHAFLDGRDTPPRSAMPSLEKAVEKFQQLKCGSVASICGRYYAMDRDKRLERTARAYNLLACGEASFTAKTPMAALQMAYDRGENDEFVQPTLIHKEGIIQEGDVVIFMNFRADRARQLTRALTDLKLSSLVTLTEYAKDLAVKVAYPPFQIHNGFGEYIAHQGLRQLRIAETEKYAHVTFFFNGGREEVYPNEERVMIPSSKVATYDLKPEMSAKELTQELIKRIRSRQYDVIIGNYANPDMVGHTGNFAATVKAIETLDICFGKLFKTLDEVGGELVITADHGNAEIMFDHSTAQPHTAHTTCLVPFIYRGRQAIVTKKVGGLIDLAPTLLYLLGLTPPKEMTGTVLLHLNN